MSSGGDEYDIVYTWETATGGRNTLRRNETTLPSGAVMDYDYRDAGGRHDADMSRVTSVDLGIRLVVSYAYNGVGQVVQMDYPEPDARSRRYGSTSGDYEDWDRFNRITSDDWTAYSGTATNFYDIDIAYDENSNITVIEDNVHDGFDVVYSMDELDRLTRAEEGDFVSGSISTTSRDQEWTLDQVGNWDVDKLDLDGDGFYTGTDEHNDDRTHNDVNELTARDTDDDGTNDFTLAYDAAGNLTDDGEEYKYEYDAFYRLRKVKNQSDALVAEHRYNGLGHRIGEHVDTDDDGDVDGSDEWRYFAYDERWRIVAHFLGSDTAPTEEFVHHAAGLDGRGGSSYIDLVALRERDTDDNGSREERMYYCQNWRADVSAIIDSNGEMYEWVKYSAYGVPFGLPGADTDSDGDCDATDISQIQTWDTSGPYDVRGDVDLDGDVDATDKTDAQARLDGNSLAWGMLSSIQSRIASSGHLQDNTTSIHSRHRVMGPALGRWTRRDPLEYIDGESMYSAMRLSPVRFADSYGTCAGECMPYMKGWITTVGCGGFMLVALIGAAEGDCDTGECSYMPGVQIRRDNGEKLKCGKSSGGGSQGDPSHPDYEDCAKWHPDDYPEYYGQGSMDPNITWQGPGFNNSTGSSQNYYSVPVSSTCGGGVTEFDLTMRRLPTGFPLNELVPACELRTIFLVRCTDCAEDCNSGRPLGSAVPRVSDSVGSQSFLDGSAFATAAD